MSLRRIVVLDCGACRVSVGVFVERMDALRCESFSGAALPFVATESWPETVAEVISHLLAGTPRGLPVVLILPSHAVLLKQMRTPRVSPAKSRQVLEFAVGQAIPHTAGELVWDALTSGTYDGEVDHLVIAAKVQAVAPILRAIGSARLDTGAILPSILALRASEPMSLPVSRPRRLLIEAGALGTTFLQTDGDRFAVRSLAVAGPKTVTMTEATSAAESGDGIVRLAQEATRTLLHFNRQNHFETPEQVILATEEAWDPDKVSHFGGQLKLAVERLASTVAAPISADGVAENEMAFTRLLGGAAIGLGRAGFVINLIPPEIRQQERSRQRKPWLVAATLLAGTVLLPPIFLLHRESGARQRESRELQQTLAPLQARSKRMQEQQAEIGALRRESERLRALQSRRTSWLGFLAALQARLTAVEDVWLQRLQTVVPEGDGPMKLVIHGYMLDRGAPAVAERIKILVRELQTIPVVAAVEGERFDSGRPHLLRFELVLVLNSARPL